MSVQNQIVKAAMAALIKLASDPKAQEKAVGFVKDALDVYQVRTGNVNLHVNP